MRAVRRVAAVWVLAAAASAASSTEAPIRGEVAGDEVRVHAIPVRAGEFVRLQIVRESADVVVVLKDADERVVLETDTNVFPPGSVTVSVLSASDAVHRLEVKLAPAARATAYTVNVLEQRPERAEDRMRVAAERAYQGAELGRLRGTAEAQREALARYEEATRLARELGDRALEADALTGAGRVRDVLGDRAAAVRSFDEAAAIDLALGRTVAAAWVYNFKANAIEQSPDRRDALGLLEQALATARAAGDPRLEGVTTGNLGFLHLVLGDRTSALRFYDQALPLHRRAGNPRAEATILANLGYAYDVMGDKKRALESMHQALPIRRVLGEPRELAILLNNIGATHFSLDEMGKARAFYEQAVEQFRKAGDPSGEGASLHNIARIHEAVGEFEQALRLWGGALALFRAAASPVREANALTRLGHMHARLGDHRQALALYEQALEVHRAGANRPWEADTLSQMGSLHAADGDHERALDLFARALALHRETRDPRGEAIALHGMGRSHLARGRRDEARSLLEEALARQKELANRRDEAEVRASLADLELASDPTRARSHAESALALAREVRSPRGEAAALRALVRVEQRTGDLDAARRRAEEATSLVESLRTRISGQDLRASFVAAMQEDYEQLVDVLMRLHAARPGQGYDALAFAATEQGRARTLLESLSEARAGIREGLPPHLTARERSLRQAVSAKAARQARLLAARPVDEGALAAVGRELDGLAADWQRIEAEIRAASPRYAALTQPEPLDLAAIQAGVLDEGTLLLEYALGAERSYLWAVTPGTVETHVLPARGVLEQAARRYYDQVRQAPRGEGVGATEVGELGRLLLGPAARAVMGARRIVIVADGATLYVPWAALPDPASADGRPLIADHELVSLPSASTLEVLRRETAGRRPARGLVAVVADPVFDGDDPRVRGALRKVKAAEETGVRGGLARLIGSRREARAILALAPPTRARVALDFAASRQTVLGPELGDYRIVHLATHGVLDSVRPELSGVVLSLVDRAGRDQDGFLRLHDVYNLRWGADLVVLSACQSGLGKEVRGEGLVGLTRGFMYAGAPRVVTTLWKVDDRATALLMERFYRGMLGGEKLAPAAALRAAQAHLQAQPRWRAPYYWAGFVLHGDWR